MTAKRDISSLDAEVVDGAASWYALQVRGGAERSVRDKGAERGHRIYVPEAEVIERRRGRNIAVGRVLMAGYVLARLDLSPSARAWRGVLEVPGVIGLVPAAHGGSPSTPARGFITVRDADLMRLWAAENERGRVPEQVASQLELGAFVRITEGPFSSFTGKVEAKDFQTELKREDVYGATIIDRVLGVKIEVSIFGRSTPVEMPEAFVEKMETVR